MRLTTVRARLTALYAGLFTATTTTVLVAVNLLLPPKIGGEVRLVHPAGDVPPGALPPAGESIRLGPGGAESGHALQIAVREHQWTATWIAAAALAVLSALVGWWVAGRVLRPVHRITATARRLSLSNLHERIALAGPQDELRELADTFDEMLDRLERAADSQRRFAANASHELRTPLAVQRVAIEVGLADPTPEKVARIRRELLDTNLRTERLIEGLMTLARGERSPEEPSLVDLAELAYEAADQHRDVAAAAGVTVRLDLVPVETVGDPVMITRLIGNLVHNGIRYNHEGGRVTVRTSPVHGVTVSNTGPPVPAERVGELFEPFRRSGAPRTGTGPSAGLGLSIVSAISEAHRAALRAEAGPEGGLTVAVRFPAATAVGPPRGRTGEGP
ncbi:sensor histidine kinase [Kitasatospora sp. NPDC056184]|uniref:sensor histidine kinase n=1 Tax=Kitasatospora sp. NPDC056184 TaxID=3345738 RepID=UPI0035D95557